MDPLHTSLGPLGRVLQASNQGIFQLASEDVIKQRKIIRARRPAETTAAPVGANPFASINLVPSAGPPAGVPAFGAFTAASVPAPETAAPAKAEAPPSKEQEGAKEEEEKPVPAATDAENAAKPTEGFASLATGGNGTGFLFGGVSGAKGFGSSSGGGFGGFASLGERPIQGGHLGADFAAVIAMLTGATSCLS